MKIDAVYVIILALTGAPSLLLALEWPLKPTSGWTVLLRSVFGMYGLVALVSSVTLGIYGGYLAELYVAIVIYALLLVRPASRAVAELR